MLRGAKKSVDEFRSKASKLLLIYFITTLIAIQLDLLIIFKGVAGLNDEKAYDEVFVFFLGVIYFFIGVYFIGKMISIRMGLPSFAQHQVGMALFGMFKQLTLALEEKHQLMRGRSAPQDAVSNANEEDQKEGSGL